MLNWDHLGNKNEVHLKMTVKSTAKRLALWQKAQ